MRRAARDRQADTDCGGCRTTGTSHGEWWRLSVSGRTRVQQRIAVCFRSPVIKGVDLGDIGVYYRAGVGPIGTTEEAAQFFGPARE